MKKTTGLTLSIFLFLALTLCSCAKRGGEINLCLDGAQGLSQDGWSRLQKGEAGKALALFEKIDDPYQRWLGSGYAYLLQGKREKAREAFRYALAKKESFSVYCGLAQSEDHPKGNQENAFSFYHKAASLNPQDPFVKERLAQLRTSLLQRLSAQIETLSKDSPEREALILKILYVAPDASLYRSELIHYYFGKGIMKEAIDHYNTLLKYVQPDQSLRVVYANALYNEGIYSSALTAMEELFKDYPDNREYERLYYNWKAKVDALKAQPYVKNLSSQASVTRAEAATFLWVKLHEAIEGLPTRAEILLDIDTHWGKEFIQKVVYAGLISPEDNHTFVPEKSFSRWELATFYARLAKELKIEATNRGKTMLKDVPAYHRQRKEIENAVALGVLLPDGAQRFSPGRSVSGKELAESVDRFSQLIRKR